MSLELLFQLTAVVLGLMAAFFLWRGQTDVMFVTAVLGAVSFFLSIRMQVRSRMAERADADEIHSSGGSNVN